MAVRHFCLDIETEGLVHIGNGNQYGKKDYFASKDKIAILDVRKFTSRLNAGQVERYCAFLEGKAEAKDLQSFLDKNQELKKIALQSIAYLVNSPLAKARRGSIQYHDVWEFVKDPYGKPYIPGSSVKGMLRTVILLSLLLKDDSFKSLTDATVENASSNRNIAKRADRQIVKKAFSKKLNGFADADEINIMKYISVADSNPLSTDDLVFAKKYDQFSKNDPADHKLVMGKLTVQEGNELSIYRECLRPGTKISVEIAIDDRINSYLGEFTFDAQGMQAMLQKWFDFYSKCFLNSFEEDTESTQDPSGSPADKRCNYIIQAGPMAGTRCRNNAINNTGYCRLHQDEMNKQQASSKITCYLGGGVDFVSKTVVGALFNSDEKRLEVISRILYSQFPTKVDPAVYPLLMGKVNQAGFTPKSMNAKYRGKHLKKGKEDHRHWRDQELGVSPHTMKYGLVGKKKYPMGKCNVSIREI